MSHIHLPDGVLPAWLWVGGYLATGILITAFWWSKRFEVEPRRFAMLGIFAALMILVMSIEIPVFPYHVNLSIVAAIILGPRLAVLTAFIVNLMLALAGHGGVTVVGLNSLALSAEMLAGYGLFHLLSRLRLSIKPAAFLAVVLGLSIGTATSYGLLAAGAPWISRSISAAEGPHRHEAAAGQVVGQAPSRHEHGALEKSVARAQINLGRLAALMFGLGAIGWAIEGLLSTAVLASLHRLDPVLLAESG